MIVAYVLLGYCAVAYLIVGGVIISAVRRHPDTAAPALLALPFAPVILPVWAANLLVERFR